MTHINNEVEAVIINWKRPENVICIIDSLSKQSYPCSITLCDCNPKTIHRIPKEILSKVDRIYKWDHNLGPFSRYVPLSAYTSKYTFFTDDDMLPGRRCIEYFLDCASSIRFGVLGQLGRRLDMDGIYRPKEVYRTDIYEEVDVIVRAYFVNTKYLFNLPRLMWKMGLQDVQNWPIDDIILSLCFQFYENLPCYLTPINLDIETLVNKFELPAPSPLNAMNDHFTKRSEILKQAKKLGWKSYSERFK